MFFVAGLKRKVSFFGESWAITKENIQGNFKVQAINKKAVFFFFFCDGYTPLMIHTQKQRTCFQKEGYLLRIQRVVTQL